MEIEVTENKLIRFKKVYNPIILESDDGNVIIVSMRDDGFEIIYNNTKFVELKGKDTIDISSIEFETSGTNEVIGFLYDDEYYTFISSRPGVLFGRSYSTNKYRSCKTVSKNVLAMRLNNLYHTNNKLYLNGFDVSDKLDTDVRETFTKIMENLNNDMGFDFESNVVSLIYPIFPGITHIHVCDKLIIVKPYL